MKKLFVDTKSKSEKVDKQFNKYKEYKATTLDLQGTSVGTIYYHAAVVDSIIAIAAKQSKPLAKEISEYLQTV